MLIIDQLQLVSVAFYQDVEDSIVFSSFKDRLCHLQVSYACPYVLAIVCFVQFLILFVSLVLKFYCCFSWFQRTEKQRICFGKSRIHGWGLFARRNIQEGEMVSASCVITDLAFYIYF